MTDSNMNPEIQESDSNPGSNRPKGNRGLLYGLLLVALAGTWGYLIWDKSKSNQEKVQLQTQMITVDSSRTAVEGQFQAALAQLDMLKSQNDSLMRTKDKEVSDLKARISSILTKRNASEAELAEARKLIAQLNSQIDGYREEIVRLQGENQVLTTQRDSIKQAYDTVYTQNQGLSQQIQLGSVLHASAIHIEALHLKGNGKEVQTSKAKRADLMRVSFNLDENRIASSGEKDIYVCITAPDGTPLAVEALGSGRFTLADGTEKLYTAMKKVNYTTGKKQTVNIDWKQNSDFKPGDYTVEIYQGGYEIGQGKVTMKKGGLF